MSDQPTRNPFALLAAYVTAVLRPAPRPVRGRRRADVRRRHGEAPRPTIRPEQRPELLGAPPTSPAGDVDDTRKE